MADRDLSIDSHFSNFGTEIEGSPQASARDARGRGAREFPPYAAAFRRRFGIENDQALELFHQTVSMKSVG